MAGEGAYEARIWAASSAGPVETVRFETLEALLRWVDGAEVFPISDGPADDGDAVAIDCMPYYRSFGIEGEGGQRATFGSVGELVARCMEDGLAFDGCDLDPSELRGTGDFAGRVARAALDDPEGGRLVLYVRPRGR